MQVLDDYIYFPLAIDVHSSGHYILTSSKGFDSNGCEGKLWDIRQGQVHNHEVCAVHIILTLRMVLQGILSCCCFNKSYRSGALVLRLPF